MFSSQWVLVRVTRQHVQCNPTRSEYRLVELQGPRCSIRSRAMYSDCTPDYIKMTALNIPAAVVVRNTFTH